LLLRRPILGRQYGPLNAPGRVAARWSGSGGRARGDGLDLDEDIAEVGAGGEAGRVGRGEELGEDRVVSLPVAVPIREEHGDLDDVVQRRAGGGQDRP
jgi:hypothetical protein